MATGLEGDAPNNKSYLVHLERNRRISWEQLESARDTLLKYINRHRRNQSFENFCYGISQEEYDFFCNYEVNIKWYPVFSGQIKGILED